MYLKEQLQQILISRRIWREFSDVLVGKHTATDACTWMVEEKKPSAVWLLTEGLMADERWQHAGKGRAAAFSFTEYKQPGGN